MGWGKRPFDPQHHDMKDVKKDTVKREKDKKGDKNMNKVMNMVNSSMITMKIRAKRASQALKEKCLTAKSEGIDGILVTVGLCIIALVLCVVMKTQLTTFIETVVSQMQEKAKTMLDLGTN